MSGSGAAIRRGEVAFLAMDLAARGAAGLRVLLCRGISAVAAGWGIAGVEPFYRCYRAYVRGKVAGFRLGEAEFSEAEREAAQVEAGSYFDAARRYADRVGARTVVVVAGLPGTGKTAVARAVAGELGWRVISTDAVRRGFVWDGEGAGGVRGGVYGREASEATYREVLARAGAALAEEGGVVLDGTFAEEGRREAVRGWAAGKGARLRVVECVLAGERVRERLAGRAERGDGLSDADWGIYQRQAAGYG
jgi:predicted kinase